MNKLYRKTALIEATQWFQMGDHPAVIMKDGVPWVETLEGGHEVTPSDWIATGVKGEHWPIKADVFAASYEEADTTAQAEIEALKERADALALQAHEWEGKYAAVSEMNEKLQRHLNTLLECRDGRKGDMGWNLALLTARAALSGSQT